MRPNSYEVLQGIIGMLGAEVLPNLAKSGQIAALSQLGLGAAILNLLASRWGNEGKMLYDSNKELRQELGNSIQTLAEAGLIQPAKDVETCLEKKHVLDGDYPTLKALTEENCNLKDSLEKTLEALAGVVTPDPSLGAVHERLCHMMRRHIEQDFAVSEQVLRTFAPPK